MLRKRNRGDARARGSTLAGLLVVTLLACAPHYGDAYLRSFRAGQRAIAAGRYAEAADEFAVASRAAQRVKDRDEAQFLRARMFERLERWEDAKNSYRKLIAQSPTGPRSGRATFKLAYLEIQHGEAPAGWQALRQAIVRYPSHGAAHHALNKLRDELVRTEGEEAWRQLLQNWQQQLRGAKIVQQLQYELGRSLQRSGLLGEAHAQLLRTARLHPYPQGSWTDDALWHASLVAEQLGQAQQAIVDLRELLDVREEAHLGSYERPRFPMAQMRIAELYRDRVGDLETARHQFRQMYEEHSSSILADDAMWQEALISLRLGDSERACSLAIALDDRFPDSRYRRCGGTICPKLRASKPAQNCPAYIRRTVPTVGPGEGAPTAGG